MSSDSSPNAAWNARVTKDLSTLKGLFTSLPDYISLDNVDHKIETSTCVLTFKVYPLVTKCLIVKVDVSARVHPLPSYPLFPPALSLVSGASLLPPGSDVTDGAPLHLSLEWTPSLTASDAILDVALRMRECVRSAEPFLNASLSSSAAAASQNLRSSAAAGGGSKPAARNEAQRAVVADNNRSSGGPAAVPPPSAAPLGSGVAGGGGPIVSLASLLSRPGRRPSITLSVGDVQDLSAWDVVVYDAKSIRRPAFLQKRDTEARAASAAADAAAEKARGGGAGAGVGSFFKNAFSSVAGAGRSIIEETFIGVTSTQIVEIRASKFALNSGTVTTALPINGLAKLKFRRDESISFYFKEDPNDPLVYMCAASAAVVEKVQSIMSAAGVKGRHTSSKQSRAIDDAIDLITLIQVKEQHLGKKPNVKLVREIMELYRLATEKFAEAEDTRHEQVLDHMRFFLGRPLVKSLLDGTHVARKAAGSAKEGGEPGFSDDEGDDGEDNEEEEGEGRAKAPGPITRVGEGEPKQQDKADEDRLQELRAEEVERQEALRKEEEARQQALAEEEERRIATEKAEAARLEALRKEEEEVRQKALAEEEERRIATEKAEAARLEALRKEEEGRQTALAEQAEAARLAEIKRKKEEEEEKERARLAAIRAAEEERERSLAEERRQRLLEEQAAVERLAGFRRQEEESVARLSERRKAEEAELERLASMRKAEEDRIREREEEAKRAAEELKRAEEKLRADAAEASRLEAIRLQALLAEEEAERQRVPPPKGEVLERSYDDGASSDEDNDDDLDESILSDLQNMNDYSLDSSQNTSSQSISPGRRLQRLSVGYIEAIDQADQILREISAGENDLGELLGDAASFAKSDRAGGVTAETDDSNVVEDLDRMLQEANSEWEGLGAQ